MNDMEAIYRDALTTRLLRRMSHALQHDLKSPVQGIYWSLELALKGVAPCDEKARAQVEKAIGMARKELARLERTAHALLVDAGVVDDEEARFDVVDLIRETMRHFVTESAMREVQLTVSAPDEPVYVQGPRAEIAQALLACVVGALDTLPAGGQAEIAVRVEGGEVVVEVLDTGPDPAPDPAEYSLGALGLRMARQTVEARGGNLCSGRNAESKRRSTCVRLPVNP